MTCQYDPNGCHMLSLNHCCTIHKEDSESMEGQVKYIDSALGCILAFFAWSRLGIAKHANFCTSWLDMIEHTWLATVHSITETVFPRLPKFDGLFSMAIALLLLFAQELRWSRRGPQPMCPRHAQFGCLELPRLGDSYTIN